MASCFRTNVPYFKADRISVEHLNKEHFIIHTILHCASDLSNGGFIEIKGLIDLLYAIRTWTVDWSKVRDISRKWGVEKDILPVMASLNQYWQTDIPSIVEANPIDLQILVLGKQDRQKEYYAKLPTSYLERLIKLRRLPDKTSQIRYFFDLLFPTPENLRWRYGFSSKWSVVPYYFFHLFFTLRKCLTGLWHQSRLKINSLLNNLITQ